MPTSHRPAAAVAAHTVLVLLLAGWSASVRAEGVRVELARGVVAERKFDTETEAVVPRLVKLPPDDAVFTEFVWIPKDWLTGRVWTVAEMAEQGAGATGPGAAVRGALQGVQAQADLATRAASVMALIRMPSAAAPPAPPGGQRLRPLWECLADPVGSSSLDAAFHAMAVMHGFSHEVSLGRVGGAEVLVVLVPGGAGPCLATDEPQGRCAVGAPAGSAAPLHVDAVWALAEVTKPGWTPYAAPLLPPAPPSASAADSRSDPAWLARKVAICEQARALGLECHEPASAPASGPAGRNDTMYYALSGASGLFLLGLAAKLELDRRRRRKLCDARQAERKAERF